MFDIEKELKKLPAKPGVYIMHDKNDKIIYVGKAISLKNRVRQYFRKNNKTKRIENMVSLVDHFEYIVTENEAEALILECNLIKKNMPKFNVLLKDDKTYPYIKITVQTDYPDVYITKEMVDLIKSKFKIRQCRNFKYKDRPCLNYHIKKCLAPCMGYVSKEDYKKQIDEIIDLLEGKVDKILKQLTEEMEEASKNMQYETAAYLRDKIIAIENVSKRQKVSNMGENDIDVIGLARNDTEVCIEMFFIRKSKMIGREHYFFKGLQDEEKSEIMSSFIKQYYLEKDFLPSKIMVKETIEDKELIELLLTQKAEHKVEIKMPQKGEKLRLVDMAENNAYITLNNKEKDKYNVLTELKEVLKLDKYPRKIECYDISNISGNFIVAGMCVMENGVIKKNLSRRFKIKSVVNNQDDPKCMNEVIYRRLQHSINGRNDGFGALPDVIFVDGGITQIRSAKQALYDLNLSIPIFGMVKNDKHQTRALMDENRNELTISQSLLNAITMFQDSVHDTAIGYHRKLRDESMIKSALDEIPGIGTAKKAMLLKKFGSVEKISEASIEELTSVKGINEDLAKKILEELSK